MNNIPQDLKYSKTHEWIRVENDDLCIIGITDFAQEKLGDLVFVDLPEAETSVEAGDEVVVVESVKTASDVYSPVSGKIIEINQVLCENPEMINQSPYEKGWIYKIKLKNKEELIKLLDSSSYSNVISEN